MLKRYFLTGLAILLPIALTFLIIAFVVNVLTKPFVLLTVSTFKYYGIFYFPFLIFSEDQVVLFMSKLLILIGIVLLTFFIGFLGRLFLLKYLGRVADYILHRIPVVNKIYKAVQDVVTTLFSESEAKSNSFSNVVLVPFPHNRMRSIGLITRDHISTDLDTDLNGLSIFVPGTPNPAMGFMLLYKREEVTPIDMKVDEAIKFMMSCGIIYPESIENR